VKFNKVIAIAVICIAAIEVVALLQGVNGTLISVSFTAIGGLIGAGIKAAADKRKHKEIESKQ